MRVVIAGDPEPTRDQARQAVLNNGLGCTAEDCVLPADLVRLLTGAAPDLVLFCLTGDVGGKWPVLQQAAGKTQAPIVAVGRSRDGGWMQKATQYGARDFLVYDELRRELIAALGRLKLAPDLGQIIPVLSAKPGGGVTTVSSNLALALARTFPRQVALAELGGGVPELALTLDLKPANDIALLAGTADRLDAEMLRRAMVEHSSGMSVLAHQPDVLQALQLDATTQRRVLALMRSLFRFSVIDLGHPGAAPEECLLLADRVIVVVGLDVPSLRLSRRLLRQLDDACLPRERLQLVANRYGQSRQLPWRQAQEFLGRPIVEWVPYEPGLVNEAMNQGQPLYVLGGRSAIVRCFDNLARQMNAPPPPAIPYGNVG